jgi:hypothetical protein
MINKSSLPGFKASPGSSKYHQIKYGTEVIWVELSLQQIALLTPRATKPSKDAPRGVRFALKIQDSSVLYGHAVYVTSIDGVQILN